MVRLRRTRSPSSAIGLRDKQPRLARRPESLGVAVALRDGLDSDQYGEAPTGPGNPVINPGEKGAISSTCSTDTSRTDRVSRPIWTVARRRSIAAMQHS